MRTLKIPRWANVLFLIYVFSILVLITGMAAIQVVGGVSPFLLLFMTFFNPLFWLLAITPAAALYGALWVVAYFRGEETPKQAPGPSDVANLVP